MRLKVIMTALVLAGLFVFSAVAFDEASNASEKETSQPAAPKAAEQASRDAAIAPNAQVNIASPPATEQVNPSVAYSDAIPREVYGVWTEFLTVGFSPTFIGWSPSFGGGVPGTWVPVPPNPPPPPFQSEWNPDIAANPLAVGGYLMVSTGYIFPPYVAGAPDGIFMTPSLGGGAPFAGPVPLMFNAPPFNWLDFPVITFDEGTASPNFGTAHMAWVEYIDLDGDPDGDANFYDDPGDDRIIWTTYSGGAFPFPGFAPPFSPGGGPMLFPTSMQMFRPSIAVSHSGTPAMPFPGAVYVAWMDLVSGFIMLDASELVTAGVGWGTLGPGPIPTVPFTPFGPVIAPGIKAANSVSLAIHNQPGSPCDGNIYLAWADVAGPDFDIYFSSSVDGGITWSPPITVHPPALPGDQWAPSMTVDPVTGHICIAYYDQRSAPGFVETWVSMSMDCGVTWTDKRLSDAGPTFPVTSIVAPLPYVGDYLSSDVTATGATESGIFGGIWNDGRNGLDQDIFFDPDCNCCNTDGIRGDADNDCTFGCITVADLSYLVAYLFSTGPAPLCPEEGNADGSCAFGCITVSDLSYLVAFLFGAGPPPPACP